MQTFLYNTLTQQREGPIREGQYLVDGKPGVLPNGWVELTINKLPDPSYDYNVETIEYREYADLQNNLWIIEPFTRILTAQEIEARVPEIPLFCTPRQFRLALINFNIDLEIIENMINNIEDLNERKIAQIEWKYSNEIYRNHPLIKKFAIQLNVTNEQLDEIFILANTYI